MMMEIFIDIASLVGSFVLGMMTNKIRWLRSDLNALKRVTSDFLQIKLVDKKDHDTNREKFYNAIRKQFSDYEEQLEIFGHDKFLSEDSLGKLNSILNDIEKKYNSGQGEKADQIRQYCQSEREELKKLLKRDMNLSLPQHITRNPRLIL